MELETFTARSRIPASAEALFAWHARPGALERLIPPWSRVERVDRGGGFEEAGRVTLRLRMGPLSRKWVAVHRGIRPGREFQDVQERGVFASWWHSHRFEPLGEAESWLEDAIEYALPFGALGRLVGGGLARRYLRRLFTYRHAVTAADLGRQGTLGEAQRLDIAVSGSSGLIGRSLVAFLEAGGHKVRRLVRRRPGPSEVHWNPGRGQIDAEGLAGVGAVVHLAGENIASGRWNERRKTRIRESRVQGTRLVAETLARLDPPPKVLINASATGFYGDRGDEVLDEDSPGGTGFLAATCQAWEAATEPAARRGIRVVLLRIGVVLTPAGGALGKMLPLFRVGLGGTLGSGRQYLSWISLEDLLGAIHLALGDARLRGPVNAVAPAPVPNAEFTHTLARVLGRPALAPVPSAAVRVLLGEMGEATALASTRVVPRRLQEVGFRFLHPDLERALRFELGRFGAEEPAPEFRCAPGALGRP